MATTEMAKAYEPKDVESHWYPVWEKAGYFVADPASGKERFSIVIPPPNVTLWLPGLDHAGIATQMVVERQLAKEGKKKEDLGREAFEARVWKWKEESGGQVLHQFRQMGFSVDWTRLRFTLDPMLSRAVREVFVSLWEKDLIYRGDYIVNWCPRCVTALSDL